jgi:hypothetical protein
MENLIEEEEKMYKEMELLAEAEVEYNQQMQQIEDAMWRQSARNIIDRSVKPLATF